MGKIKNVNLSIIFAIMAVAIGAIGYVTMVDQSSVVNAGNQTNWDYSFDTENYTAYGEANDGNGPVIKKNKINFTVFLNPGEYKTYSFEVVNNGNVNNSLVGAILTDNSINSNGLTFTYKISKGTDLILDSVNGEINSDYNYLYRNGGKNTVEVTISYNPSEGTEIGIAVYELKLNYEAK